MSDKFAGQAVEFSDGKRRRLTVGSESFKQWFDRTVVRQHSLKTELATVQDVIRTVIDKLTMPVNPKTGNPVKSGKILGNVTRLGFNKKASYTLTDTAQELAQAEMLRRIYNNLIDAGANPEEYISIRYEMKENFRNVTDHPKWAEVAENRINVEESTKTYPEWTPEIVGDLSEILPETETADMEAEAKTA